ncbi:MAG: hypothetical protein ACLGIV_13025 [Actinomycetes bacterium]
MTRFSRPAPLAAFALVAAATAGCSVTNPQTTAQYYVPSDGAEARLGADVTVTSVLFLAADEDSPGTLLARVVNEGTEPVEVTITGQDVDVDVTVDVDPNSTVEIGPDGDEEVLVEPMGAVPGTSVPLMVSVGDGSTSEVVRATVLDDTLEEYADLVPSGD